MFERRIIALEERLAFQENELDKLNFIIKFVSRQFSPRLGAAVELLEATAKEAAAWAAALEEALETLDRLADVAQLADLSDTHLLARAQQQLAKLDEHTVSIKLNLVQLMRDFSQHVLVGPQLYLTQITEAQANILTEAPTWLLPQSARGE